MYTRFKSQKSGLKLGLNSISNPTRARVVALPAAQVTGKKKQQQEEANSQASKSESLNSSSSTSLSSIPSAVVNPIASVVVASSSSSSYPTANSDQDLPYSINSEGFPLTSVFAAPKSSSHKKDLNRNKGTEEVVDPATISYVKSLWEKYTSELGTQNGPQRHVDDAATEYPHLNGFVALDMEHWWAERSISSMINEKSLSGATASDSSSSSSSSSPNSKSLLTASRPPGLETPSSSSSSSSSSSVTTSSISSPTQLASPSTLSSATGPNSSSSTGRSFDMNDLMLMNAFAKPYSSTIKGLKFTSTTTTTSTAASAASRLNTSNLNNIQMCFS